jgi:hypothetical protein
MVPSQSCPYQEIKRLAVWISAQRQAYKNGKLSEDKIRRLNALSWWTWNAKTNPARVCECTPVRVCHFCTEQMTREGTVADVLYEQQMALVLS